MKKILLLLKYYKSIGIIPLFTSVLLSIQVNNLGIGFLIIALMVKLFILLIIWFISWLNYRRKENLYFYFNQGISQIQLYIGTIIIDSVIFIFVTFCVLWIL
jgi:hypothetical protein